MIIAKLTFLYVRRLDHVGAAGPKASVAIWHERFPRLACANPTPVAPHQEARNEPGWVLGHMRNPCGARSNL